jgi:hypothetical protein
VGSDASTASTSTYGMSKTNECLEAGARRVRHAAASRAEDDRSPRVAERPLMDDGHPRRRTRMRSSRARTPAVMQSASRRAWIGGCRGGTGRQRPPGGIVHNEDGIGDLAPRGRGLPLGEHSRLHVLPVSHRSASKSSKHADLTVRANRCSTYRIGGSAGLPRRRLRQSPRPRRTGRRSRRLRHPPPRRHARAWHPQSTTGAARSGSVEPRA